MKQDYTEAPYFLRDFLTYMEAIHGKSKNTVKEYYFDLRTFLRYMKVLRRQNELDDFESIPIDDIDVDFIKSITLHDLYEYLSYTSSERLNNANSRARKVASLRSFFKYMNVKAKLIPDNPAKDLDSPKIPKSLPKYLTLSESRDLLNHIDGHDKLRDYAIITLFLNCGLRLSELAGINLRDIKDGKLTVIGKGNKERIIYLNHACESAVDAYVKNERPTEGIKPPHQNALFIS
ncbi:MAG: tyrosine-type recombinase/integrase, partial [Clostridia bacterium]